MAVAAAAPAAVVAEGTQAQQEHPAVSRGILANCWESHPRT